MQLLILPRMRPLWLLILIILAGRTSAAQSCPQQPTGLVLSGGGAKGLAHIGVLRVLDSLGIRPDLVVGSSMGAIIGGLYASGYSGREIDSLARSLSIADLFRAYQPQAPRSLGPLQPLIIWEQGDRRFTIQSASVSESEVNALVNAAMLRGNLMARGDFDSLPIPFRAVAADLADRSAVVIGRGDLARAVRASFAIPFLFSPESLGGRILADGGLAANVPISAARASGAARLIVSDATERLSDSVDLYSPIVLADRLLGFLFQQPGDSLRTGDILVRPAVEGFTGLNFSPGNVDALIRRGAAAAEAVLPGVRCLPGGTPPNVVVLPRWVNAVTIRGRNASERLSLRRLLGLGISDSLDPALLRSRVRHLANSEAYQAVWLSPQGRGDSVSFDISVRRAPRRIAGLGLAYDNELGGRMWVGAVERRLLDVALEGSSALFLGEFRKELSLGFRRNYQLGRQLLTPTLTVRLASESVRRFDLAGHEIDPDDTRELHGYLGVEHPLGLSWQVGIGAVAHDWQEPGRELGTVGLGLHVSRATRATGKVVDGSILLAGAYRRISLDGETSLRVGPIRMRPRLRLGWGERLPIQATFPLGGDDGFPGLHIGERRGDREALADVLLTYAIKGPFVARVELAAGRSAGGGPLVNSDGWLAGARAGIGAETPVGPVRFEYGVSTGGREAVFIRLGRWF
jgi:NTE family protein